ncbi:hypothetical protein [Umezakia ovalisporum]|uniref:Uncharacterized protein n=2 Tax=Umezakia ovalisporum TaxID=75695 RepID=A0AA43H1N1_9CYAN|nr:hypothetical protein [Umezakia ovalisporum]MDH6056627.1 hypothetical protein [Umezakia ovalisporum FSS-43]MDH6065103.1 hypothetical protein [Umezakia ovalisporum FSS-62]MDH6070190.1 hypothetical protein [Umezakia ovalisporum CobakiLakeA]MDH6075955.1 hypothetical protein [Umezakia ovalisporum CS-1034]MDH6076802.1 hypothetical protein [Umezakia ovalisporum FSS-45]
MSTTPPAILDVALQIAEASNQALVTDPSIAEKIDYVSRYVGNRAVVRLLLACSLAAIHRPDVDIRKVYAEQESAVTQPLKEAFLALRQAAESAREF